MGPGLLLAGCADEEGARRALDNAGYTEIRVYAPPLLHITMCGDNDFYKTRFSAKNVNGKALTGTVCSGQFKGSTIRFD
jgi:hypothetical protein